MNSATKRTGNVVLLRPSIEHFRETVTPETGQSTVQIAGGRGILNWLKAGVKALWGRDGTDRSPSGRDLKEMVLIYGSGDEPDRNEATSHREALRRCSGIQ